MELVGQEIVIIELNFETLTLGDFEMYISNNGSIFYDKDETIAYNKQDIFDTNYVGQVSLVFLDDSISSEQSLKEYKFRMRLEESYGGTRVFPFLLENIG